MTPHPHTEQPTRADGLQANAEQVARRIGDDVWDAICERMIESDASPQSAYWQAWDLIEDWVSGYLNAAGPAPKEPRP